MSRLITLARPQDGRIYSDNPVCGVMATAVCTGNSFDTAKKYYQQFKSNRWKGALSTIEILKGIRDLGGVSRKLKDIGFQKNPVNKVVNYLAVNYPNRVFVIFVRQHVLVSCNLTVVDQGGASQVGDYYFKRKRVESVYEIETVDGAIVKPDFVDDAPKREPAATKIKFKHGQKLRLARELYKTYPGRRRLVIGLFITSLDMTRAGAYAYWHKVSNE